MVSPACKIASASHLSRHDNEKIASSSMRDLDSALLSIIFKGSRAACNVENFRHVLMIIFRGYLPWSQNDAGYLI